MSTLPKFGLPQIATSQKTKKSRLPLNRLQEARILNGLSTVNSRPFREQLFPQRVIEESPAPRVKAVALCVICKEPATKNCRTCRAIYGRPS